MFCFLILFPYYRKSLFPCFGNNTTDVKTKKKCKTLHYGSQPMFFLGRTQYQYSRSLCHRRMKTHIYSTKMYVVPYMAVLQLQYSYEYDNWNPFKKRSKGALAEIYPRRFSTAFRTATKHT